MVVIILTEIFDIDDNGLSGHDKKLFERRFRLFVRKFIFSRNSLPGHCINCNTVNTFEMHILSVLEPQTN